MDIMPRSYGLLAVLSMGLILALGYVWQREMHPSRHAILPPATVEPAAGPASAIDKAGSICVTRHQICRVAPAPSNFPCSCYDNLHGNVPGNVGLDAAISRSTGRDDDTWMDEQSLFGAE